MRNQTNLTMSIAPSPNTIPSVIEQLRGCLRGAWLSIVAPTAILLLVVLGESVGAPSLVVSVVALLLFFCGFGLLVRSQFARRRRNADVFVSFVIAEILGFALLALVLMTAFRH